MSTIPLHYITHYRWRAGQGGDVFGEIGMGDKPSLCCGGPNDPACYDPEHMVVAAVEICLANTFFIVADKMRVTVREYHSQAQGQLVFEEKQGFRFSEITVRPQITCPKMLHDKAKRALEKAHQACLVSRSLHCPVRVEPAFHGE